MSRRAYAGGAAATTLSSGINSVATSIPVADASTWPSSGAFSVVIDRGQVGEEKILIASRSGNTLTVSTRGYDSTSAAAHSSGATIEHVGTSIDFDEANAHVNASSAVHGLTGTVVGTSDSQTLTNKTLTSPTLTTPTIADFTNANHTHASTAQGGSTLGGAMSSYTPALGGSGWALGNGTVQGRYFQIGKLVFVDIYVDFGTTTTANINALTLSLPVAADTTLQPVGSDLALTGTFIPTGNRRALHGMEVVTSTTAQPKYAFTAGSAVTLLSLDTTTLSFDQSSYIHMSGWYIAA